MKMSNENITAAIFGTVVISLVVTFFGSMILSDHLVHQAAVKMVGDGADPIKVHCMLVGINHNNREICMGVAK